MAEQCFAFDHSADPIDPTNPTDEPETTCVTDTLDRGNAAGKTAAADLEWCRSTDDHIEIGDPVLGGKERTDDQVHQCRLSSPSSPSEKMYSLLRRMSVGK